MKRLCTALALGWALACNLVAQEPQPGPMAMAANEDPYQWLEGVKTENESWVWHGAQILKAGGHRHVLINLSRGGADAAVYREFDLRTRSFVKDGFQLPEAKGSLSWIDKNHV